MTQQEHLTTEQLSAFLDEQLTPQEQAFFDAHIQSCQRCQNTLAELRRTVALLHAMPQPQLPRSFTLPASISHTQQPALLQPQPARQERISRYTLRRTVRAVSTLAAAIAVIFILSGLLANVHPGGGAASTAGSAFSNVNGPVHSPAAEPDATGKTQAQGSTPRATGTPIINGHETGTPKASPATTPTPAPTPTSTPAQGLSSGTGPTGPPTLPPALDPGQPTGRLTLGALLLLLSIAGLIATRRRRRNTAS